MRSRMAADVEAAMAPLTDREREVLRLRFGLGLDREMTLVEIGRRLSLTRERVRQIEAKALAKLRARRAATRPDAGRRPPRCATPPASRSSPPST